MNAFSIEIETKSKLTQHENPQKCNSRNFIKEKVIFPEKVKEKKIIEKGDEDFLRKKENHTNSGFKENEDIKKIRKAHRHSNSKNKNDSDEKKNLKKKNNQNSDESNDSEERNDSEENDNSESDSEEKKKKKNNSDKSEDSDSEDKKKNKKINNSDNSDESDSEKKKKRKKKKKKSKNNSERDSDKSEVNEDEMAIKDNITKSYNEDETNQPLKNDEQNNSIYNSFKETQKFIESLYNILIAHNLKDEYPKFFEDFSNYISLIYFSIIIIGKVKAGKSTFLNYILDFNSYLEIDANIATKFICIIRHNKNNKKPRIYNAIAEKRGDGKKFNFIKGEEIKDEISKVISERNKKIAKKELNLDPLNYFLIVEANLPIFNGTCLEKYSDIFEFMDVPGLNEAVDKEEKIDSVGNNFYFKEIIPTIIPNAKFFILMFDSENYQNEDSMEIIEKINEQKGEKVIENSLFILNKIDICEGEEEEKELLNNFIKNLEEKFKFLKGKLIVNENVIGISAKKLLSNRNKYKDFKNYIEGIIVESQLDKKKKNQTFSKYLKEKFQKEIKKNIEYNSEEEDSDGKEDQFPKKLKKLKEEIDNQFNGDFSYEEYKFYKKKFKKYNKNKISSEDQYSKIFFSTFLNKIESTITEYQNIENYKNIKNDIMKRFHISSEEEDNMEDNSINKYLKQINKDPTMIKEPLKTFEKIEELVSEISITEKLLNLKYKYYSYSKILTQERFLRFLTLGGCCSGKSFLLNTIIIGQEVLPVDKEECTKIGIILRHCNSEKEIGLYLVDLIKNEEDQIFYFNYDSTDPLATSLKDIKEILNFLNQNSVKSDKISFYLIKMPLKIFDYVKVEDELKTHLEFIDFPGLNTEYEEALSTSKDLIRFTNGFFFIQGIIINENDNKKLLNTIIETIRNNNNNFSFKCCLFLMNKCDKNKIDLNKYKLEFGNLIENILNRIGFIDRLANDRDIKSLDEINFTKFSSFHFLRFLEDYKAIINIDTFFNELFNNKENNNKEIKIILESIKNELKRKYFKIHFKDIKEFNFDEKELSSCTSFLESYVKTLSNNFSNDIETLIVDISKYYIFIKHNYEKLNFYVNSNAEHCFKTIADVFDNTKRFYKYELNALITKCLINFGVDLNKIMGRIYTKSSKIDPSAFTQEKRENYLNKIENLSKEVQLAAENKIHKFDLNSSIIRLRKHKKKTRDQFTNLANEIAESNNKQLKYIQNDISNILEKYKKELDRIVKELLDIAEYNKKKYKKSNNLDYDVDEQDFNEKFKSKKNIVEEMYDEGGLLPIMNCIPFINFSSFLVTGVLAFVDWFRSHEAEHEEYIVNYEKNVKEKVENYKFQVKSSIITMRNSIKNYVSNIFDINGEDLEILKQNKEHFNKIWKKFENILIEIINSN